MTHSNVENLDRDFWVWVDELNVYSSPAGQPINRLYKGQKVQVRKLERNWGRISEDGFDDRWVLMGGLSRVRPDSKFADIPGSWIRPNIRSLPTQTGSGLRESDIRLIWAGANLLIDKNPQIEIVDGDKSVSRVDSYYVLTSDSEKFYFRKADVIDWMLSNNASGIE